MPIFERVVLIHFVEFCKTFLASRQALELLYSLHYFFGSHDHSFVPKNVSENAGWFSGKSEKIPIFERVVLIHFVEFRKIFLASRQALELLYSL